MFTSNATRITARLVIAGISLALLATACGGSADSDAPAAPTSSGVSSSDTTTGDRGTAATRPDADSIANSPTAAELPSTAYATGDALLADRHVGAVAIGADLFAFDEVTIEFDLDLDLPDVPTGPAFVGFVDETVVAVPLDLEAGGLSGTVIVLSDTDALMGELTDVTEDANEFLIVEGTVTSELTGETVPVAVSMGPGVGTSTFEIEGTDAIVRGALGARTLAQVEHLIAEHPNVERLVLQEIEGSVNDEINVVTVARIREAGLDTHVPADGEIYSGGVDLFAGGVERTAEPGATIGVHAWCCGPNGESAHLIPVDDDAHSHQRELFRSLLGESQGDRFYFFTLQAAPFDGIEVMTPLEWGAFDLVTADDLLAAPEPLTVDLTNSATDIDAAVAAAIDELGELGRSVEVLIAIGGADPTAVLALDADTAGAAIVTLDYDVATDGIELVGATIASLAANG